MKFCRFSCLFEKKLLPLSHKTQHKDAKNNMAMGIDFCSNAPETAGRQQ
jgi:hypothetical protein